MTFTGQRHRIDLSGDPAACRRIADGLEDAEFRIAGQIVADIGLEEPPKTGPDGNCTLTIEALTVAE